MAKSSDTLTSKKVLIVEDDKLLADMLRTMLTSANVGTEILYTGEKVYQSVKQGKFDLIFLDIMMPVKNGFEVLKELKADPQTKNVPVVILTNLGDVTSMQRGLDLGASDYLIKVNMTADKIRQLLDKYVITFTARENTNIS